MNRFLSLSVLFLIPCFFKVTGQPVVVDEIVAVVGDKRILYSDIEQSYLQLKMQGDEVNENTRCQLFEDLLMQKLLLNQAEIDSIEVTESQIEMELNSRMQYFISVIGSEQKLEEYYNKSILEIKQDLYDDIREQLLTQKMQSKITENLTATPSDVKAYYKSLPVDSLPYIDAEVEYNQILIYPKSSEQAILAVREKLLEIRERVLNGESFATLAVIYSEDEASSVRGGDIGWFTKSELDPEYAKAAFALKKGVVSKIVESSFGYHLIQCIDITETRVHTRHILLRPKIEDSEKSQAVARLDSIVRLIRLDSLKFEAAAVKFSQDEDTKVNGGQAVNRNRGGARWKMDEFEQAEYKIVNSLKVGEISDPYASTDTKGKLVYKVIWLKSRSNPHVGNLNEDYNLFKSMALQVKQSEAVNKWVEDKIKTTYLRISDTFAKCPFQLKGWTD
jgi:peptidyl-prolyl cis-trans isomerase SurA